MLNLKQLIQDVLNPEFEPNLPLDSHATLTELYQCITHLKLRNESIPEQLLNLLIAKENDNLALTQFLSFIKHLGENDHLMEKVTTIRSTEHQSAPTPQSIQKESLDKKPLEVNTPSGEEDESNPFLSFLKERSNESNTFRNWNKADQEDQGIHPLAYKSIEKDNNIASESLARVLVSQGKIREAIAMYEQLILTKPEKRRFFAEQIEKLS